MTIRSTWRGWNLEQLSRGAARFLDTCSVYVCTLLFTLESRAEACKSLWGGAKEGCRSRGNDRGKIRDAVRFLWGINSTGNFEFLRSSTPWIVRFLNLPTLERKVSALIVVLRFPELCLRESRDFWIYKVSAVEWRSLFFHSFERTFMRIVWFFNLPSSGRKASASGDRCSLIPWIPRLPILE